MSRRLYIAVRGAEKSDEVPASNNRRLYSSEAAAWAWIDSLVHPKIGGRVHEVDLDETVKLSRDPEPTWQARYEHAERRATRWLGLMERLEPLVKRGEKPSDTWTLKAVDLVRLVRVFSGWKRIRETPMGHDERERIQPIADDALLGALTDALASVTTADVERGK